MTSVEPKRSWRNQLGRWLAELLLVFLGAYAAFWLTGYQQHQQDAKRRDQLLASLEQQARENIKDAETGTARQAKRIADFERALAAGEMPPLQPISFSSDYNAGDVSAFLQAGGLEVLDVKTIVALRKAESAIRAGLSRMAHDERLSDQLIVPNLDEDISFFYDPATKKLRKRFNFYLPALRAIADLFHEEERANHLLFEQIQEERQRRW
ncbi:MAG: hypothetical protein ABI540_11450 [Spartobacteria bacterium]